MKRRIAKKVLTNIWRADCYRFMTLLRAASTIPPGVVAGIEPAIQCVDWVIDWLKCHGHTRIVKLAGLKRSEVWRKNNATP